MVTPNLQFTASLAKMTQLSREVLERPGQEPETDPQDFEGRSGYSPSFLNGWNIPLPKLKQGADMLKIKHGASKGDVELKYEHFSVIMSKSRRLPLITATNIDGSQSRSIPRISTWSFDGRLDKGDQWGDALYYQNDLDRGHMVRREDPVWGTLEEAKIANRDTFHFTNSCPQMAGVNQKTWVGLENYVLSHAREDNMFVSVFTGPFFTDDDVTYRKALVPKSFWKIVAIIKDDGSPSATAYRVSQEKELSELEFVYGRYKTFQISILEVIKNTGIDFGDLEQYDGFSQEEIVRGTTIESRIDSLEMIRV